MLTAVTRETAVARSLDFVEMQNNVATTAVASIELVFPSFAMT
jgi:hypothetical protein